MIFPNQNKNSFSFVLRDITIAMIIMGIDPGTARIGWSIIECHKGSCAPKTYGLISTSQTDAPEIRLLSLFEAVETLCLKHKPDAAAVEDLFFATNAKTAIAVGQARGTILTALAKSDIPVYSYSPLAVKRTITGNGNADKKQITDMVVRLLKLSAPPKPDDTADALAIALTHAHTVRFEKGTTTL